MGISKENPVPQTWPSCPIRPRRNGAMVAREVGSYGRYSVNLQQHESGVMIDSPFTKCPKFKSCSVNNCPLHPSYPNLSMYPEDPAKKCMVSKVKRVAIGDRYQGVLRFGGMTRAEFGRTRSWAQRSVESRQHSITAGTKNLHERHFLADLTANTNPRLNSGVNMG